MRTSPWRLATYLVVILLGLITALPNILGPDQLARLPSWLTAQSVTLGLDLQGGSHLVLEVDSAGLETARLRVLLEDAENALREVEVPLRSRQVAGKQVEIELRDTAQTPLALVALRDITSATLPTVRGGTVPEFTVGADDGLLSIGFTEQGFAARVDAAIVQSLEVMRRRVDEIGVAEPTVQRVGADRILVQLPGLQDPTRLRTLLGSTAQLTFHMLTDDANAAERDRTVVIPSEDGTTSYRVLEGVALSGERLIEAYAGFDVRTREPIVSFRFDSAGTQRFADITRANVGKPFAIVLDGKVLSAPVIREPILAGSGQISGQFSAAETTTLAALLRAGALPAPLTVIEERTVGPDQGGDAIRMGIQTGLLGFALVAAFMLVLYRGWGLIANLALALNVVLTIAALGVLGATLTLPGIAGIILGIGLAVDANILINERIKEETSNGASARTALQNGFKRAYATIVDSNVTTLIATALLFTFGTGPVRGFAITMMLGIAISMFTAVAVVRVIMAEVVRRWPHLLAIRSLVPRTPASTAISFMKARYFGLAVSAVLSIASIVFLLQPGLSYGLDFKGGIQMEVRSAQSIDLAPVRATLSELGLGEIGLQAIGDGSDVLVRVERQPGDEQAQTAAVESLRTALAEVLPDADIVGTDVVGPKISDELAEAGIFAVIAAVFAMLVYIWWRFEWYFAVGAIATLVLDVTKAVGFFALTGLEFNLTAIAALLTIIGYSVNDKVVVYDRMRENLKRDPQQPLREIIDKSINQSLSRCIFTSAAAFFAMLPMALHGGPAVASFALPMVFGIVVATSSSIFIAAPILLLLGDWHARRVRARPRDAVAIAAVEAEVRSP